MRSQPRGKLQAEDTLTPKTLQTPHPSPPRSKNSDCGRENTAREDSPKQDENRLLRIGRQRAVGSHCHCQHSQSIRQEGRAVKETELRKSGPGDQNT